MYEGCWGANKITIRSGQKGELALFFICLGCIKKSDSDTKSCKRGWFANRISITEGLGFFFCQDDLAMFGIY